MNTYKKLIPIISISLLYIILIWLYVANPLGKNLYNKEILIFLYAIIGLVAFWKIKLYYILWTVASVVLIAYYFIA